MEPHITRSPALIHPRLVVPESLSRLSSLPEYLKELMAPAQQIPVGRDLAQHAPGMWIATHLLQNLPNTRKFCSVIIVFTERLSTRLHSNCGYFSGAVLINLFWEGIHTGKDPLLHNLTHFPGQSKPYPQPHIYCYPQLFAGIAIWLVMFFYYLLPTVQSCQQNPSV